ncbi:FKBP-type peptidyl-prolyl cis-trans isomerase [uncultured Alistipes sp.]|jgi:hypothetical protein|uniref:FKBP-type peptidyl-prolyl cis-trans isomerase n=1 Tax=uncultured Alistipes sp. TaxID=538949 RepID=UPI0026307F7B|nr:FKBP-type peptidyl-prolyl cis-trans isomerase [uncultured Alistipes sp.]
MKKLLFILLSACVWCGGCDGGEDVLPGQQSDYAKYLASTHVPRLLSEEEARESLDRDPAFYTAYEQCVFRYIRNFYDPERPQRAEAEAGDVVELTLSMYAFEFANLTYFPERNAEGELETTKLSMPFFSNNAEFEQAFYAAGLTPGVWSFEPLKVELGRTPIIKGLELALPGVRERDTVEIYMTYNMAYGGKPFGLLPKQSPVAAVAVVETITKN